MITDVSILKYLNKTCQASALAPSGGHFDGVSFRDAPGGW